MKAAALALAATALAGSAFAQPPKQGWVGAFPTPSILCDTSEQVQSILTAFEGGVEAGTARFAELYVLQNHLREPTCAIAAVRVGLAVESENLGRVEIGGAEFYGWIVHIENAAGNAYYLHLESPAEVLRSSI
jgi:hypothetical protein